jgi:ATP-dependent Clp protease protease subunit
VDYLNPVAAEILARAPHSASGGLDDQVYNRLLRERIIFLGSVVEDSMANAIAAQILLLAAEDSKKDIFLYVNSPGGSVTAGMAIYDTMQYVQNDVATVGMGLAASMGQFLLCSGAAGKRYALPHARIMMHQPSSGIGGTATDIKIQAEQIGFTKRKMAELIAHHTGQTIETITADSDRDRWFTADEAKDYGFVDHVVRSAGQVSGSGGTAQ